MNNEMKETKLTIRVRNYNGDYGIGSIFNNEFNVVAKQLVNNPNKEKGLIIYTENIGFCCDENLGSNPLATIKTEIPFLVDFDKFNIFNKMIEKIKTNPDYKYNETHYATDKFDPKRLEYFDITIDGEEFESNSDEIFKTILHDVIDVEEISGLMDDYYQKLSPIMRKRNKIEYDDPSTLNIPYEERIVTKLVDKIKNTEPNIETTIAQLLELSNEDVAKIEPLTQGTVFNNFMKFCEELNINIEVNHDEIGGLGYHYKFKKLDTVNENNI